MYLDFLQSVVVFNFILGGMFVVLAFAGFKMVVKMDSVKLIPIMFNLLMLSIGWLFVVVIAWKICL